MVTSFGNYSSLGATVGSSFVLSNVYGICIVFPGTTYLTSQKVYCWIHGGDFLQSLIQDYPSMIHSNQFKSYSSSYMNMEDLFSTDDGSRGNVGTSTTHFSSQKVGSGRYRHDERFQPYQSHCTVLIMT